MSDERMQPLLEAWFKEREATPYDVRHSTSRVMARLPGVRQRGRWLPFPMVRRKARTPTATDTTEYRPSPIPATNGHAATVIGRTQTMLSPIKAITAGALVFALGGLFLIVQPLDQQGSVPSAEQGAEPVPPAYGVRITSSDATEVDPEKCTTDEGGYETCTWASSGHFSATDPRLSGTATSRVVEYGTGDGLEVESIEIVNDEGTWVGTGVAIGSQQTNVGVLTLTGAGAYEGFTAFLISDFDNYDDRDGTFVTRGFIIEGELPPFPEVPAQ